MTGPTFEIVTISPDMARVWLAEHNHGNRTVRQHAVTRYAADMAAGRWTMNGASIVFDEDGRLIDGQHRLIACIKADREFTSLIMRGAERPAVADIDTGAGRTLGDLLKWQGVPHYNRVAAAIRVEWKWSQGKEVVANDARRPTNAEALDWLDLNPSLPVAASEIGPLSRQPILFPGGAGVAFLHQITMIDREEALSFVDEVATGTDLRPETGSLALRNWCINQNSRSAHTKPKPSVWLAVAVKAWNLWITGETANRLAWKRGGTLREAFPDLLNADGEPVEIKPEKP